MKIGVMEDLCDITVETYRQTFDKYVERTPDESLGEFSEWLACFVSHIPAGGAILEIGSASGSDARYFASKGLKVICTDVIVKSGRYYFAFDITSNKVVNRLLRN